MYIKVYFLKIRLVRDIDTVTFFPEVISFPKVNTDNFLRYAAEDIISILAVLPTPTTPSLEVGDPTRNELLKIAKILKRTDILLVAALLSSQADTENPRVKTPKGPSLYPVPTPTTNI